MKILALADNEPAPSAAAKRDWQSILLNAYVPMVLVGFGVCIAKDRNPFVHNSYYPAGPLLLVALVGYLLWLWWKTTTERRRLQVEAQEHADDRVHMHMIKENLDRLFRKMFLSCQLPLAGLMVLNLFR